MFWFLAQIPEPGSAAGRQRDRNAQGGIKWRETCAANPGCEEAEWPWSDRMEGKGSITPTMLPPQPRAAGERRCPKLAGGGEEGSNSERTWGGERGSYSSSLITLMHDSMSTGNIRHKIPYFLFSLICSEKAFLLVLLSGCKERIIFCKCLTFTIWQSNWILLLSYNRVKICIFHFTNQKSFCFT